MFAVRCFACFARFCLINDVGPSGFQVVSHYPCFSEVLFGLICDRRRGAEERWNDVWLIVKQPWL